jgi:hypothetical protein
LYIAPLRACVRVCVCSVSAPALNGHVTPLHMLQPIRLVADVAKAGIKKTGEAVKIMTGEEDFHFGSTIRCAASWVTGDKRPYPKLSPDNHHGVAVDGRRVKVRPHALPCNSLLLHRVI